MPLTEADIQPQLNRRRPGQSALTTPVRVPREVFLMTSLSSPLHAMLGALVASAQRNEADVVKIQSGTENGITLGSPISLFVANQDQRPADYSGRKQLLHGVRVWGH